MCWVRPGFLEANANCFCCVNVLIHVDFPALERPTKAISGTSSAGKKCNSGAVVRNRAVCSHPIAMVVGLTEIGFVEVVVIDLSLETRCVIVEWAYI